MILKDLILVDTKEIMAYDRVLQIKGYLETILLFLFYIKFALYLTMLPNIILKKYYEKKVLLLVTEILKILSQFYDMNNVDLSIISKEITKLILLNFNPLFAIQIICPSTKRLVILLRNLIMGYKSVTI